MRDDLKLSYKALILVSVPLVFELIFVCTLSYLLVQADREVQREVKARSIMALVERINISLTDAGEAATAYSVSQSSRFLRHIKDVVETIPADFTALKALTASDRAQLQAVEKCKKLVNELLSNLSAGINEIKTDNQLQGLAHLEEWGSTQAEFRSQADDIISQQETIARLSPAATALARERVMAVLAGGLLFNIVLAFGLVWYFHKGTTRRLNVLMDNSFRLSRHEELNPVLQGQDEIAHIDRLFHDMAEKLGEADRLKQEFFAMVSHDLRSPLTSVQAFLMMLKEGFFGEISKDGMKGLESADRSANRLIGLVNDLLDLDKLESGMFDMEFNDVPIDSVIDNSIEAIAALAEKRGIRIETARSGEQVRADSDRLVQVLVNLLANAVKFSPPGEAVTISVNRRSDQVEVRVADKGRGVPEHMKMQIFERFRQVSIRDRKEKGGSGLGLAICRAVIQQHGGAIGVNSQEGEGSTFWFRVPAAGV